MDGEEGGTGELAGEEGRPAVRAKEQIGERVNGMTRAFVGGLVTSVNV